MQPSFPATCPSIQSPCAFCHACIHRRPGLSASHGEHCIRVPVWVLGASFFSLVSHCSCGCVSAFWPQLDLGLSPNLPATNFISVDEGNVSQSWCFHNVHKSVAQHLTTNKKISLPTVPLLEQERIRFPSNILIAVVRKSVVLPSHGHVHLLPPPSLSFSQHFLPVFHFLSSVFEVPMGVPVYGFPCGSHFFDGEVLM